MTVASDQAEVVRAADENLSRVTQGASYLLSITPTNTDDAYRAFADGGFKERPVFHYRPLDVNLDLVRRELYDVQLERIEDETIRRLLEAKRSELIAALNLLELRDTPAFAHASISLHGEVEDELLLVAERILGTTRPPSLPGPDLSASEFVTRARRELDIYRAEHPGLQATVELRHDVTGLMVVYGHLLVGAQARFRHERVEALIQHEIGTHVVTYENGAVQPLKLLSVGLAGYEETQEALAVFAEFIVGGLEEKRLALLAARVLAARLMSEGRDFTEVFTLLRERGADPRTAWNTTFRAFRGGGTTKDAMYLRGLLRLLDYLKAGRSIEPLLAGKLPLEDVPLIEELLDRNILTGPVVRPRWLSWAGAEDKLRRARTGLLIEDLVASAEAPR